MKHYKDYITFIFSFLLLFSVPVMAQASTGLGKRTTIDTNKGNALDGDSQANWFGYGKVKRISGKTLYVGTSEYNVIRLLHYPNKKVKVGDLVSCWVRMSPKETDYKMTTGGTRKIKTFGFLQYRDPETKLTKRNQKKAF